MGLRDKVAKEYRNVTDQRTIGDELDDFGQACKDAWKDVKSVKTSDVKEFFAMLADVIKQFGSSAVGKVSEVAQSVKEYLVQDKDVDFGHAAKHSFDKGMKDLNLGKGSGRGGRE